MRKIIVIGYPKSGNTWITRLTGELLNCPIKGFLYSDHIEEAVEGLVRESEFEVYKSHHQLHELSSDDILSSKLIYIIRDPRDVSISGRKFFSCHIFTNVDPLKTGLFNRIIYLIKTKINNMYRKLFGKTVMRNKMNKAVLKGNFNVHHWCRISWKTHISPYINNKNVLKVQYEAALENPLKESKRILDFLGVVKDEKDILNSIENQSFTTKKKRFLQENQTKKAEFLRAGKSQQWKTILSKNEKKMFVAMLKKEFEELGYDLD